MASGSGCENELVRAGTTGCCGDARILSHSCKHAPWSIRLHDDVKGQCSRPKCIMTNAWPSNGRFAVGCARGKSQERASARSLSARMVTEVGGCFTDQSPIEDSLFRKYIKLHCWHAYNNHISLIVGNADTSWLIILRPQPSSLRHAVPDSTRKPEPLTVQFCVPK